MATKHPGITLVKPKRGSGRASWRATWIDPDTGERKWVRLDPDKEGRNQETRIAWAQRKAVELRGRKLDLDTGAPLSEAVPIAEAVERFYEAHPDLRGGTLRTYRVGTRRFVAWAERAKLQTTADLNRRNLMKFRESVVKAPKRTAKFGGDRGEYASTGERRAPRTVNRELREVKRVLDYLRKCDLLAHVTRDDLLDAFEAAKAVEHERREYLSPKELQGLLEAAQRHDEANPDRLRPVDPIAPFVAFVLLTGMRLSEALSVEWGDVKLDALDHGGKTVGEIHIRASATKTRKARTVGLEVSPMLRKLLAAQRLRTGGQGRVFEVTEGTAKRAKARLLDEYGAPKGFTWQTLRATCGTYLVNAVGIYGRQAPFMESRQLGHSVTVAERDYVGLIRGIDPRLRTLEDSMQVKKQVAAIVREAGKVRAA